MVLVVVALVRVMHVALFVAVVLMVIALVHVVAVPMVLVVVALVRVMHVALFVAVVLMIIALVHVVWHLNLLNSLQRQSAYVYLTAILPLVEASGRQILHPMRQ